MSEFFDILGTVADVALMIFLGMYFITAYRLNKQINKYNENFATWMKWMKYSEEKDEES